MFEGDRHTKWRGCQYTESGDTLIVGKRGEHGCSQVDLCWLVYTFLFASVMQCPTSAEFERKTDVKWIEKVTTAKWLPAWSALCLCSSQQRWERSKMSHCKGGRLHLYKPEYSQRCHEDGNSERIWHFPQELVETKSRARMRLLDLYLPTWMQMNATVGSPVCSPYQLKRYHMQELCWQLLSAPKCGASVWVNADFNELCCIAWSP